MTFCDVCDQEAELDDGRVYRAYSARNRQHYVVMGEAPGFNEGMPVVVHASCAAGNPTYRRVPDGE